MGAWIKSLWKDSLVYGIGYGVSRLLQIIILPIIAQALSLSEFGYYSNYVIFYTVAGGFFILGLDSAVARYFYDSDDTTYHRRLFSSALYFLLLLSILSVLFISFFPVTILHILDIPVQYRDALPYVLLCIPAVTINSFFLSWFKWKRQKIYFLINSAGSIFFLLVPLLVASKVTFTYVFQVIFWSQLLVGILSLLFARDYLGPFFNGKLLRSLLAYGFPWMLVFIFGISRTYLDRVFLTKYLSDDSYGLYNFSIRISTLISLLITAFDMSFGPLAFSIWNKEGAPGFFARLQSIYIFIISVVACVICVTSPLIIQLLGGARYQGADKIIPVLLFAAIPLSLINFSNLGTVYAKKSFLSTLSLFVGFGVVLLLNLLLTHIFLQYGATFASLTGHLMIITTGYYLSARYYKIPFSYGKDAMVFVFFFILSLVVVHFRLINDVYINMFIELLLLGVLTFLMLIFLFPTEYRKAYEAIKGTVFDKIKNNPGVQAPRS